MSLQLLLEDFLGLMREEGELDAFLPILLSAMGHEIVYRAQKGVRQYGADIVSYGTDEDREKKLFIWLVKCGDIGRTEWDSGEQSVRPSINDVVDVYLKSHVPPQFAGAKQKLVVLTNGDFKSALSLTVASFLSDWTAKNGVEAAVVNGSTLATWTERFLLDENVLPADNKILFRRMLANVLTPEICLQAGRALIQSLVAAGNAAARSAGARRKKQLTALRAIRTALNVLTIWGQNEGNLLAPYRLSEFVVLAVWAGFQAELVAQNKEVTAEFTAALFQMLDIGASYHEKITEYYRVQNAFASALPDSLLVTERVFEELGRLGLQASIWAMYGAMTADPLMAHQAEVYGSRIAGLIESHKCSRSPCYDHQAMDVHAALLGLMATGRHDVAVDWLGNLVGRLGNVAQVNKYWPLTASFQDALEVRYGYAEVSDDMMNTTILVPILAVWCAALGATDLYEVLRTRVMSEMTSTTLNVWSSDDGFDALVANPAALSEHGVGEAMVALPVDSVKYLNMLSVPLPGTQSIEDAFWYRSNASYIPVLAAVHWRLQIPREMLAKHVSALAGAVANGVAN